MTDLSVIIVSYNVRAFLEQCLVSVQRASEGLALDVWVVDNHSVDGSVEMVQSRFPEVHLIANEENVGFSKANNQAIRESQGRHVLLLNPDTVVREDTFRSAWRMPRRTLNSVAWACPCTMEPESTSLNPSVGCQHLGRPFVE